MFTWSLKHLFYFPTKQNTEILFGCEHILTAKYKFQVLLCPRRNVKSMYTLFSKGTNRLGTNRKNVTEEEQEEQEEEEQE